MLNESNIPLEEDGIEEEILVDEEVAITKAMWGDIGGNIENQTDLQNALDAKQDSLTEAQLSAVNSGITAGKVETYDGYADQIASKADQSALNAESTARGEADTALGTRIDNEALARQSADNGLQTQIDAITSKSDVVDVVANYAALQAYDTSTLGNNDVVKVLDDETHEDALTYYRWSTTTQTWSYIGQEAPYYSKGQMDAKLAEKQDKLTAGANIQIQNGTISATDTTYTAGNGLNLNDTEFSADTDVLATKEDLEGYYTKSEADNLLAPKLEAEMVAELPTTGAEGKLYLTPKAHTTLTATGNPIEATVTEQAGQLESFQLDGDTFQQTYTGRNILPNNLQTQTINGVTFTRNADGSITIKGTATARTEPRLWQSSDGGSLVFASGANYFNTTSTTIYYYANAYYSILPNSASGAMPSDRNCSYAYIRVESGESIDTTIYPQIVEGDAALDYEPFVGGQPSPSPEFPQQIQTVTGEQTVTVTGKNLLNITSPMREVTNSGLHITIADDGKITIDGTATGAIWPDFIWGIQSNTIIHNSCKYYFPKALEAVTYSIKIVNGTVTGSPSVTVVFNDDGGKNATIRLDQPQVRTATDVNGINRVYLNNVQSGTIFNNFQFYLQIESGTTATEVVPYSSTDYPISLGSIELCKLGTYQDYIYKDGENWKIHKSIKKFAPTGEESYSFFGGMTRFSVSDVKTGQTAGIISTHFIREYANNIGKCYVSTNSLIAMGIPNISTEAQAQAWVSANRPEFYCELSSPTDTTITDTALIAQLEAIRTASLENGTNTITNTATGTNLAGDMEIGYYGFNPTNRYDKFIWLDINNNYEQIGGE